MAVLSSDTAKLAAQVEWIRAKAIPLKTVEAGNGFDDMMPLKGIVGDARVVALGEATHGTREFFQLKHRLVEFLAQQMGFTIFTIGGYRASGIPTAIANHCQTTRILAPEE